MGVVNMISTPTYDLIHIRRIRVGALSAQIATRRIAYSPDRLYACPGKHAAPTREWEQVPLDSEDDFIARVKRELAGR